MISFLVVAWRSTFFSSFRAVYQLREWWCYSKSTAVSHRQRAELTRLKERVASFDPVLLSLCDLQIATGLGIVVAGFSQIKTMTYYHGQLVQSYWFLTTSSFWVIRVGNNDGISARAVAIVINTIMGNAFNAYTTTTQRSNWHDVGDAGFCFRWYGSTSSWPWGWTIFISIYIIEMMLEMSTRTRELLKAGFDKVDKLGVRLRRQYSDSLYQLRDERTAQKAFLFAVATVTSLVFWVGQLFAALFVDNGPFFPLRFVVGVALSAWETCDVILLRVWNDELLADDERKMGFGQVLPLTLLFSIVLVLTDIWSEKRDRTSLSRADSQSQRGRLLAIVDEA